MLLHRKVEQYRHRFAVYMEQMKGLSPLQKLNQGYAYIEDVDKKAGPKYRTGSDVVIICRHM